MKKQQALSELRRSKRHWAYVANAVTLGALSWLAYHVYNSPNAEHYQNGVFLIGLFVGFLETALLVSLIILGTLQDYTDRKGMANMWNDFKEMLPRNPLAQGVYVACEVSLLLAVGLPILAALSIANWFGEQYIVFGPLRKFEKEYPDICNEELEKN